MYIVQKVSPYAEFLVKNEEKIVSYVSGHVHRTKRIAVC